MWNLLSYSGKLIEILIFFGSLKLVDLAYYYCPDGCVCDIKKASVKCNGNAINSNSIPSGIASKTVLLSVENYNFSTLNTSRLFGLKRLRDLRLRRNGIVKISKNNFAILSGLSSLDLSQNEIRKLDDFTFVYLTRLRNLDLSNNKIITLGMSLQKLNKLVQLNIGSNQLTQLDTQNFLNCRELRYIYAEKNKITKIEPSSFLSQVKLTKLKLKSNQLGHGGDNMTFQRYLSGKLRAIDLSDNQFSAVPEHLPIGLQELRLSANNLTQLSMEDFEDFYRLEFLYLQNNNISHIQDSTFKSTPKIKKIWLNSNALTAIPPSLPPNLVELYLQDNNIGIHVSALNLSGLNSLSRLHLQDNAIESIAPQAFKIIGHTLKTLMLHNNKLSSLKNRTFSGLNNLNFLSLSKNPLTLLELDCFSGLDQLKVLRLSHMGGAPADDIHSLIEADENDQEEPDYFIKPNSYLIANPTIFRNVPDLEILSMTNSSALVHSLILDHNSSLNITFDSLVEIEIGDNGLENIPHDFMDLFPKIIELNLSANMWKCDSLILPLLNMINNPTLKIKDKDKLQCSSPEQFFGRALINLTVDDIEESDSTTMDYSDIPSEENFTETLNSDSPLENGISESITSKTSILSAILTTSTTMNSPNPTLNSTKTYKYPVNFRNKHLVMIIFITSFSCLIAFALLTYYLIRVKCVDSYARFSNIDNTSLMSDDNEDVGKDKKLICYFKRGGSNIQILNSIENSRCPPASIDRFVAQRLCKPTQDPDNGYIFNDHNDDNHITTRTLLS